MTYRTIVADPPWRYDDVGIRGGTARHYEPMALEAISAIDVPAADDAHLYLWTTNSFLRDAFDIMAAWGFRYLTTLTWHKLGAPGVGHYFRGDTEHVLFGVKGNLAIPPALRVSNHFAAPRTRHSEKPARFYEIVERVSPPAYLELFARRRRYDWDVWGNEAPEAAASQAEMGLGA